METNKSENFLQAAYGNYLDCIKNAVYSLQKYMDIFHYTMNDVYLDYGKIKDPKLRELFKFAILESESISKAKAVSFTIETESFLNKKYNALIDCIKADNDDRMYRVSEDAYLYLDQIVNNILFNQKEMNNPYNKVEDKKKDVYQFVDYMNQEFDRHRDMSFTYTDKPATKTEVLHLLSGIFMKLSTAMLTFKKSIEHSTSVYVSALICRQVITLLVASYKAVIMVCFAE
jgi:hypothetical protein